MKRCAIWLAVYGLGLQVVPGGHVFTAEEGPVPLRPGTRLPDEQVVAFARLALEGLQREYPNKPSNVLVGPESVLSPRALHPAFYGCFDWHSSVHGHWMLLRLLRLYPECSVAGEIRSALGSQLTTEKMFREAAYFEPKENRSFERMYGWAWALRLATELHVWKDDSQVRRWRESYRPLERTIVDLVKGYLPRLTWPVRTGVHPDTAFALGQVLDYARAVSNRELEELVIASSRRYYLSDRDYSAAYEPSGEDFFSPGLNEADLMRRVLEGDEFSKWLDRFLPGLKDGKAGNLLEPVEVSDVTDGKLVHLAGLDFSRAWTLLGIASVLRTGDPRREVLERAARAHAEVGLRYVFSGHYEGEHWLATFAVYLLTTVGKE